MVRQPPRSTLFPHDALPIFVEPGAVQRDGHGPHGGVGGQEDEQYGEEGHGWVSWKGMEFVSDAPPGLSRDRKSTRLNSSHGYISYAVFCLKKKNTDIQGGIH